MRKFFCKIFCKIFRLTESSDTRVREANLVQTKFLVGWGLLLFFAILLSAFSAAFGQGGWFADFESFFQVFAVGTVVAGASAMVAWLLGLLFGIPRSIARPGDPAPAAANTAQASAAQPTLRVNTNLEDVSDWLTKTLIGVGLTQLFSLPHKLWQYALAIDQASLHTKAGGAVFILGVALTGGAGGFWVGYVTTRTFLTFLFDLFGKPDLGDVKPAADPANLQFDAQQKPVASADPLVQAADIKLRTVPLDQLTDPTTIAAWGGASASLEFRQCAACTAESQGRRAKRYQHPLAAQQGRAGQGITRKLCALLLPACGEKVGMRGPLRWAQTSGGICNAVVWSTISESGRGPRWAGHGRRRSPPQRQRSVE